MSASTFQIDPRISQLVPGFDAPFFQGGLAGYSDAPMRLIARTQGCPYCVTEALLDRTLISGGKGRTREDPELLPSQCRGDDALQKFHSDHPIAGQIIGSEPEEMAAGAMILVDLGYDVIDVNFACPVRKLCRRNRGGHLLTVPQDAIAILKAVREAVPTEIPTTVKLRRSYNEAAGMDRNFQLIFDALYELGYAWATVHCRTVEQKYAGPGKWEFLTELVRQYPDRLIFGSGDIWRAEDIFTMLEITGVNAVSVARGCIGNPWIFRQAREMMAGPHATPTPPTLAEQRDVLLDHFLLSMTLWGEKAASRMMRKFGIKFSCHHTTPDVVKEGFIRCQNAADWKVVLQHHYGSSSEEAD